MSRLNHTKVDVTTSSTQVVAGNTERSYLLIQNISDTAGDLMTGGADAVADEGIRLAAGDSVEFSAKNGNLFFTSVAGIHAGAGTKRVTVTEAEYR